MVPVTGFLQPLEKLALQLARRRLLQSSYTWGKDGEMGEDDLKALVDEVQAGESGIVHENVAAHEK